MRELDNGSKQWTFRGRSTGEFKFGRAGTGTDQIGMLFEVLDGEWAGRKSVWYGTLGSSDAIALAREAIEACSGKPLEKWTDVFGAATPRGNHLYLEELKKSEVTLVFEQRPDDDRPRLCFINRVGVFMKDELDARGVKGLLSRLDRESPSDRPARGSRSAAQDDVPPEAYR